MSKLRRMLRSSGGMTLVEIMTGFAILALVMVVSLSILFFSSNVLNMDSRKDRMKILGDEMYKSVSSRLLYAGHIQLLPTGSDPSKSKYDTVFFVREGRLYTGPKDGPYDLYVDEAVYMDTVLSIQTEVVSGTVLSLRLAFTRGGESVYETASSFKIVNMLIEAGDDTEKACIEGEGSMENPVISYDGGAHETEPPLLENPYTVFRYPEGKTAVKLDDPDHPLPSPYLLVKGEIYEYGGLYWQSNFSQYYNASQPPGTYNIWDWKALTATWEEANPGGEERFKSAYEHHDVVMRNGKYYICTYPENFPTHEDPASPNKIGRAHV